MINVCDFVVMAITMIAATCLYFYFEKRYPFSEHRIALTAKALAAVMLLGILTAISSGAELIAFLGAVPVLYAIFYSTALVFGLLALCLSSVFLVLCVREIWINAHCCTLSAKVGWLLMAGMIFLLWLLLVLGAYWLTHESYMYF